jgi:D-alanyl-D-alanine carboxypeptidase
VVGGIAVVALVGACTSSPPVPPNEASTSRAVTSGAGYADQLRSTLAGLLDSMKVPSAVVVVRSPTFGDATLSFGTVKLGENTAPNVSDHYRIGSNTKPMTATVVLQLVQEGRLTLEDPISRYRPDVPNGQNITIGQLLNMRSGLASYTEDPVFLRTIDQDKQRVWQPEELLKLAYTQPALFAPGASWHYSNTNYILLGLVMEQLTGKTVSQLFQERLFSPLGMRSSVMPAVADASIPEPYAHGYHFGTAEETGGPSAALPPAQQQSATAGTLQPQDWTGNNPSWGWTAGSAISTADDLAVFVGALVDGGLLDASMQQRRLASVEPPDPANPSFGYGYGLMRFGTYYGHNGQLPGYNSWMVRDPKTGTTLIILTSLTSSPDGKTPADVLGLATLEVLAKQAAPTQTST